jgi:hypothetical protein
MAGRPIRRARKRPITLADGTIIAFPKLTHPRAGLSHAQWRGLSPVEKIERQLGLSLDQMAEIIARPWEGCDAAWMAIKTRVWCVFWAIGAKMIRAWANGTLDLEAVCGRARQRDGAGPLGWRAGLYGENRPVAGGGLEIEGPKTSPKTGAPQ